MSQPIPSELEPAALEDTLSTPIEPLVLDLITALGEDPAREGLVQTPARVERSLRFLTGGYGQTLSEVIGDARFQAEGAELVVVRDIEFYSLCEHHMLPFFGRVHIAYLPDKTILGLSKFGRIVDMFARRLQVQERLTTEIADAVADALEPKGVAVAIEASHMCMMMRGVQKQDSVTRTLKTHGSFADNLRLRQEALEALK